MKNCWVDSKKPKSVVSCGGRIERRVAELTLKGTDRGASPGVEPEAEFYSWVETLPVWYIVRLTD